MSGPQLKARRLQPHCQLAEAIRPRIAPAVLSQAGAPLSWTIERADTFFVCERVRKAAALERQPQRAGRAMYTEVRGHALRPQATTK
jgi:hypothetical protein